MSRGVHGNICHSCSTPCSNCDPNVVGEGGVGFDLDILVVVDAWDILDRVAGAVGDGEALEVS